MEEGRPSGTDAGHRQGSKTINDPDQQRRCEKKFGKRLVNKFKGAELERNSNLGILWKT